MFPAGVSGINARMVSLATGVRLHIAESGPPTGFPLVMVHGWGGSLYMFRHAFQSLPSQGVRTIGVDLRGYGLSDHPRERGGFTYDAYAADFEALLDALELPRVAILAQSMGGGLALRFALGNPDRVRGLVLVNPSGLVPIPWVTAMRFVPRFVMELLGERAVPRWLVGFILRRIAYGDPSRVGKRDIDEYWAATQIPGYVRAVRGAIAEFDWRPLTAAESATLAVPSVVILGENDRLVKDAREPAERLKGSTVLSLPGGHCVHEESPETVYPVVADFVARLR